MSILYPILAIVTLSIFSAVVLPIMMVIFVVGVAGLAVSLANWKMRPELYQD